MATAQQLLISRQKIYKKVFGTPEGEKVLKDLALFCRANETTYHKDQRMSDILIGRREVWLRVQQHLKLSDGEIWDLYR